eukprot:2174467-Amphidinium_carterae.1
MASRKTPSTTLPHQSRRFRRNSRRAMGVEARTFEGAAATLLDHRNQQHVVMVQRHTPYFHKSAKCNNSNSESLECSNSNPAALMTLLIENLRRTFEATASSMLLDSAVAPPTRSQASHACLCQPSAQKLRNKERSTPQAAHGPL